MTTDNLLYTETHRIAEPADGVPTSWLDPLLSGPDAALHGSGPWGCPDIERLLKAVKARVKSVTPVPEALPNEWIAVADDLPDTNESQKDFKYSPYCLVWVPGWKHAQVSRAVFLASNDHFCGWVGQGLTVTHWMQIPAFPSPQRRKSQE